MKFFMPWCDWIYLGILVLWISCLIFDQRKQLKTVAIRHLGLGLAGAQIHNDYTIIEGTVTGRRI